MNTIDIALFAGAYLLGSLSTAIILCRLLGLPDPRTQGSGNPGATNVLRFGGKKLAALTLLGDMAKGLIPVLIARTLTADPVVLAAVAMAAFLGHLYPLFFGFKGGKGVATAVGVLFGLAWPVALAAILTWLVMAALFRISSLSALTAAVLAPAYMVWLDGRAAFIAMTAVMSLFLLWRHRANIQRLLAGEEKKIGKK
ncbi:glycerol-3-phosphate 1-O-acyltransferase PlsY [Sulfurivermis fontis]|jgi:glycerol-3-phosphate acyltransferase PlsY|uniref:glycerol-3-phosphate 1-O-acyltransferase PlsY n=1 Tax=Sulfurivermis fontis TaxID=1972068 RepID=UPI000FD75601|nr:glycerol-3-phosphate 1-O-acyltransferase PlsY [Sulfurivermis fontis]